MNKMNMKFIVTPLIFAFVTTVAVTSCNPKSTNTKLIYSQGEDVTLVDEISMGFGFDSILISKGDYPITFDENKHGRLVLKVLKTYGTGNGEKSFRRPMWTYQKVEPGGKYCNGLNCQCWGFGCRWKPKASESQPKINYKFTLSENELVVDMLEKVPFGEEGYELK